MSSLRQPSPAGGANAVTAETILAWIQEWTEAHDLKVPADLDQTFADAGFDSMHSVELAFFLEERLNTTIDETVLYDYPSFASLVRHLMSRLAPAAATASTSLSPHDESAEGAGGW